MAQKCSCLLLRKVRGWVDSMMRASQQRLLVALVATAIGAAVGALAGYWIGHTIVMGQALGRLDQQAMRILAEGEASKSESRQVLKELNGSAYSFCSDAETHRDVVHHFDSTGALGKPGRRAFMLQHIGLPFNRGDSTLDVNLRSEEHTSE